MDQGFDGVITPEEIFLDIKGCVSGEPQVFSAFLPFDVTLLDAYISIAQGNVDMSLGVGAYPLNYFGFGTSPGTQWTRVSTSSYVPLRAGSWFVTLTSPKNETTECDPNNPTDWHLVMRRTGSAGGTVLLSKNCRDAECAVPMCTVATACNNRIFPFEIPSDASSLQVILESVEGDADLFISSLPAGQMAASMNGGPGFDIIQLGPDVIIPLQGQAVSVELESWQQVTQNYNLRVAYSR